MKKVSVIIACYNHAEFLKKAVESALSQDYLNLEIIIVNDGSTDCSSLIAHSLRLENPETIKVIDQENSGVVAARNNAIIASKGSYIIPLDADDYFFSEDVITKMVIKLETDNSDLVFGNFQCFGNLNLLVKTELKPLPELLITNFISATSLYKRKIFNKVGGYSEYMKGGYEDWEFAIRVFNSGKISKLEETIFYYRTQEDSRNIEAEKKRDFLLDQCVSNNKEIYTQNIVAIISKFRETAQTLRNKAQKQKKKTKYITYFAIVELITIIILIIT